MRYAFCLCYLYLLVDLHTAHWHGNEIITSTDYTIHDVVKLLPSYSTQVDMITDNPGIAVKLLFKFVLYF